MVSSRIGRVPPELKSGARCERTLGRMPGPVVTLPHAGELIGDAPDRRVELLCDRDALHATWSRFGPGRDGADLHVHRLHADHFYVLSGELTIRLGLEDEQVAMGPGTLARVPPMVVHGFRNAGDVDVTYLNLHAPGVGFAGFMRGLRDGRMVDWDQIDPPADGLRPASLASFTTGGGTLCDAPGLTVREVELAPGEVVERADACFVLDGQLEGAPAGSWVGLTAPPAVTRARVLALRCG